MPREPAPTRWRLEEADQDVDDELVAVGADLEPGTLLAAYRVGLFPMGLGRGGRPPIGWWSPQRRGVLLPGDLHVSRSLQRSSRHFEVTVDEDFEGVVRGCADPRRSGAWITGQVAQAYLRLHELGWAHSVEVRQDGALVGGLYGVQVGGLFAGESMFHRVTDASKAALVALEGILFADGCPERLVDVQWQTPHLASLGVREMPRAEYRRRLAAALRVAPAITPS